MSHCFFLDDTLLNLSQTDNKDREPSKVVPIKHPKMKNLRQEQMRRMKDKTKETELNGNTSDPHQAEPDQDTKRTESSTKKNNYMNKQDVNDGGGSGAENDIDEAPKEKPRPHNDRNKFAIEMNEGGAFVPEPYQYVPTFDDKLLEREYKVSVCFFVVIFKLFCIATITKIDQS